MVPVCTPCAKLVALHESTSVRIPSSRVMSRVLLAEANWVRSDERQHAKCHSAAVQTNASHPMRSHARPVFAFDSNPIICTRAGRAHGSAVEWDVSGDE